MKGVGSRIFTVVHNNNGRQWLEVLLVRGGEIEKHLYMKNVSSKVLTKKNEACKR